MEWKASWSSVRRRKPAASTALTAVALQDHWVHTLAIGATPASHLRMGPPPRSRKMKDIRPVVDTGRAKPKQSSADSVEKEYVLDERPPPLTLAQKFGLVAAPPKHLSEGEWSRVKAQSNAREDSKDPCVICKEDFGLQEQVLLSCSHVFHKACLQAFERYTGRKTCPMCRREHYQTRVIHEGAKQHKIKCATVIQATWRGYVVRCWYKKLRETVPPKDPKLRKKFYTEKLKDITDRMVKSCDFDVNLFLTEIDTSLQRSRNIFRHFDALHQIISEEEWEAIQLKAVERANRDCPICLTSLCSTQQEVHRELISPPSDGHKRDSPLAHQHWKPSSASRMSEPTQLHLPPLVHPKEGKIKKEESTTVRQHPKKSVKHRKTVLLSCTHVFHETCLLTLEELALGDIRNTCPVCRAVYQKRVISL